LSTSQKCVLLGHVQLVAHRVVLVALDQHVDVAVEGGREQDRAPVVGALVEESLHLGQEAHVGHAVGLVEDDDVDAVEADQLLVDEVGQAARAGDDDVDAAAQRGGLAADGHATEDGLDPGPVGAGQHAQLGGDLGGQLAGGHQHQAPGPLGPGPVAVHDERDAEGEGLSRPGGGTARHVAAGQPVGQGEHLDGEGFGDAAGVERRDDVRGHAEIGE
jgi:hypothetical protein